MKKVLIIFGGNSFEHEVSCMSVNFIKQNIDRKLFNYDLVGIDRDYMYVCLYSTCGTIIEFSDIEYIYTGKAIEA